MAVEVTSYQVTVIKLFNLQKSVNSSVLKNSLLQSAISMKAPTKNEISFT